MRIYEILDSENEMSVGILQYYEKEQTYIIELQEYLDEWSAPLLFTSYVKKNIYTIPRDISFLWVKERVIPSGRQNIKAILDTHKLAKYDEMKMLEISAGKCSQDSLYIKKLDELPEFIVKRRKKNLVDCVICEENTVLCFFEDETVKKVSLGQIEKVDGVDKVMRNLALFESGKVGTGGYCITFNDSIDIPSYVLYNVENSLPLKKKDFDNFINKNILDTSEICDILECTRQNVSYMLRKGLISPVKAEVKGNLYLKGDVLKNKW